MGAPQFGELWPLKLSDQLTLIARPRREGVAAMTADADPHAGLVIVGGESGLGAPRVATSRRQAIAPATAPAHWFRMAAARSAFVRYRSVCVGGQARQLTRNREIAVRSPREFIGGARCRVGASVGPNSRSGEAAPPLR